MEKNNIILHRINTIEKLNSIDQEFGCEIDIRAEGSNLILHHDAFKTGEKLTDFLDEYRHGTLVLNVKETGIENALLEEVKKRNIKSFFLLDVEQPYLIKSSFGNQKNIALRFSEYEPIENVKLFANKFNWIWIDTISLLPIDNSNFEILNQFNVCVVCPSLWKRSDDILKVKRKLSEYNFNNLLVMTEMTYVNSWIGDI
jgi:hypothetical protein